MIFLAFAVVNVIIGALWLIKAEIKVSRDRKVPTTTSRVLGGVLALGGGVIPLVLIQTLQGTGLAISKRKALIRAVRG